MGCRRALCFWFTLVLGIVWTASPAHGQTSQDRTDPNVGFSILQTSEGRLLDYHDGDVSHEPGNPPPKAGWKRTRVKGRPFNNHYAIALLSPELKMEFPRLIWYRVTFDPGIAGSGPLALLTDQTHERTVVFLNGVDLYRSYAHADQMQFGWNRPRMMNLPRALLRPGQNEVIIRLDNIGPTYLMLGALQIGQFEAVRAEYDRRLFWRVTGPRTVNGVLVILTLGAIVFWFFRRKETVFGWLALVGLCWFIRNMHYYDDRPSLDIMLYWQITWASLFVLMIALYGFAAEFFQLERRRAVIFWSAAAGLIMLVLNQFHILVLGLGDMSYLGATIMGAIIVTIFFKQCRSEPNLDNFAMLAAIILAIAMSVFDLGLMERWWTGPGFFLQPYASLIVFSAFGFALGRRILRALFLVETMNEVLEARVAEATDLLTQSEVERRRLEVTAAVEQERTRLMREIHDGIGSNLVTALAVAQNQKENGPTVDTLKRSIADLRAAIDSLEPTEGDLTLLLASFRHRMEPELRKAGLSLRWHVDPLPPFEWLEATNALHVLRIFQEIIANCIKHAQATEIAVSCRAQERDGRRGICVEFLDNGTGLPPDGAWDGKGIANMKARAEALLGQIEVGPHPDGRGTRVALWLPYERRAVARPLPRASVRT